MTEPSAASVRTARPPLVAEAVAIAALLIGYSLVQAPVPGVNEPHYLTKAHHFWHPGWCAGDLFLESDNTHLVFYVTFGWLAAAFDFVTAAIIGRAAALAMLAAAWVHLSRTLESRPLFGFAAAAAFLLLHSLGNWSGEWVVGGVESKVPAYAAGFSALAFWISHRIRWAGLVAGLAVSFHPLVGGWLVVAVAIATAWGCLRDEERDVPLRDWAIGAGLFFAASLPGLMPAIAMLLGADPAASSEAARIQVVERLSHHLNARTFERGHHQYFAALLIAWLLGRRLIGGASWRRWERVAVTSLAIAAVGLLLSFDPGTAVSGLRIGLLKFYLFRLADVLVPMSVAFLIAAWANRTGLRRSLTGIAALIAAAFAIPTVGHDAGRLPPDQMARWLDICEAARTQTPPGSLGQVYGPTLSLKWYAGRPEYLNYKDMPQDADSLLEWQRRREVLQRWPREWADADGFSVAALEALHAETGIDFLIVPANVEFAEPPLRRNRFYQLVPTQLHDGTASESSRGDQSD